MATSGPLRMLITPESNSKVLVMSEMGAEAALGGPLKEPHPTTSSRGIAHHSNPRRHT